VHVTKDKRNSTKAGLPTVPFFSPKTDKKGSQSIGSKLNKIRFFMRFIIL
jgi:hypothetical protein